MGAPKYEILEDDTITVNGRTLKRIRALRDFNNTATNFKVKMGELGGYIESDENLSQKGSCWVQKGSSVLGNSKIKDNAYIKSDVEIGGDVKVGGKTILSGPLILIGKMKLTGKFNSLVFGGEEIGREKKRKCNCNAPLYYKLEGADAYKK